MPDNSKITKNYDLIDFFFDIPNVLDSRCIPPLKVINSLLLTGERDAGMGGFLEWEPFRLSESEYDFFVKELLDMPSEKFFVDEDFREIEDFEEWILSVFIKYFRGSQEMLDTVEEYYQEKKRSG